MTVTRVKLFLAAAAVVLIGDLIWLSLMTEPLYGAMMGDLLRRQVEVVPSVLFYVFFVFGLSYFVLWPAAAQGLSAGRAGLNGALFGLVCYGAYDLTAWAVIAGFDCRLSLIDMGWGSLSGGVACLMSARLFFPKKTL